MTATAAKRRGGIALCLLAFALFSGLGVWQVERLAWKRDLIARVDARTLADPVDLASAERLHADSSSDAEYVRVRATGVFLNDRETLVDALTERGPGAWVLTPLRTERGVWLVNRGFVPPENRDPRTRRASQPDGVVTIVGLLRLSEPGGRVLRPNVPAADRWFSRDVAAIASARGLGAVAPWFIDADASPNVGGLPVGGLTVVRFRNAHLAYALTWFALAALAGAGLALLVRARAT